MSPYHHVYFFINSDPLPFLLYSGEAGRGGGGGGLPSKIFFFILEPTNKVLKAKAET